MNIPSACVPVGACTAGIRPCQPHVCTCHQNLLRLSHAAAPAEQEPPAAQSAPAASPAAVASAQPQSQDFSEGQLNRVLKTLDESVGQVIEALPVNAMLVLYTCQGDTVQCRMMQVGMFCMDPERFCTHAALSLTALKSQIPCCSGMLQCSDMSTINQPNYCVMCIFDLDALPSSCAEYCCNGAVQEQKMKRQQGVDNLPPWTLVDETEFSSLASRVCRALCFASVKQ